MGEPLRQVRLADARMGLQDDVLDRARQVRQGREVHLPLSRRQMVVVIVDDIVQVHSPEDRPTVRFAACSWLLTDLINAGIPAKNIDLLQCGKFYDYGAFQVIPVQLTHNVPNCGYKLFFAGGKAFYATDTNNLNGITAKGYDLYLIECNYEDQEIHERIKEKEINGEFAYEKRVIYNHLSKLKCDAWIYSYADELSEYFYLHQHKND